MAGKRQEDLTGLTFGNWEVREYLGRSKYLCKCLTCGAERRIDNYSLKDRNGPKCNTCSGTNSKGLIDLTNKEFGDWKVIEYAGDKKWLCECKCGIRRVVNGEDLRNGKSRNCGHSNSNAFIDLTDKDFEDWHVIKYIPEEGKWLCRCSCGKLENLTGYQLRSGKSKSCGHNTTGFKDLTGKHFGCWKVIKRYEGDNSSNWICECTNCGTRSIVSGYALRSGNSKSCGCLASKNRELTNLKKYGVRYTSQIGTSRTKEQLEHIKDRDSLIKAIQTNFKYKPTTMELANILGIDRASTMHYIHKFKLEDYIEIGQQNVSRYEKELNNLFPCNERDNRDILNGLEIDLLYKEKSLGIEFNGNYWHSSYKKDRLYHQEKSIKAIKAGIRLIHIYEYEWNNDDTKYKLIDIIDSILNSDRLNRIYARKCDIYEIENSKAKEFLQMYHIQGSANAKIWIGCYYKNELIGLMGFGASRFNSDYEYELIRLCWRPKEIVIGGSERIFKYFKDKYNPSSVISYCDIGKFTGNVYNKLGFKYKGITSPNYRWVKYDGLVLPRYKTMKHKLIEMKLGTEDETEDEIMIRLGFMKIYDSGNAIYIWDGRKSEILE